MTGFEKIITSTSNPTVKRLRALRAKKGRDEEGLFVVEGMPHVEGALEQGWELETFAFSPRGRDPVDGLRGNKLEVTDDILSSITGRDNTQPVIGVFRQRFQKLDHITSGLWLGLEEIRDPGNLGTIIRTADAVSAKGIVLIGDTCDPFSPEAIRATTGSFARIPFINTTKRDLTTWRKSYKGHVIGTHLNAKAIDYRKTPKQQSLLLLMGSESAGLSPDLTDICDTLVKIPMTGGTESLNLAVSAGIMLYELKRDEL